jgi:hypothetical protein
MPSAMEDDGYIYFELKSCVYGKHESAHEFNDMLDKDLKRLGLQSIKADPYLYTMKTEDGIIMFSAHVDDLLFTNGIIMFSAHVDDLLFTTPNITWR